MVYPLLFVAVAKPRITSLALFKNGYAVVMREATVEAGASRISEMPASSLGTLWIAGKDGLKVLEAVNEEVESKQQADPTSLEEMLTNNVGKAVTLQSGEKVYEGTILSAQGTLILLATKSGTLGLPKSMVTTITGADLRTKVERTERTRSLRLKTDKAGTVTMLSLERGATWAPSYAVDVSNPKILTIYGKATILNDLDDLDKVDVRMITGFPNVPYAHIADPLVSGWSVDQFVAMLGGGARFDAGQMAQNQAFDRRAADAETGIPSVETSQTDDLFMYQMPGVTLKKGERAAFSLFSAESAYENIYTWEVENSVEGMNYRGLPEGPGDVWNTLKFKNTGPIPLTTGPATTYKNGMLLGQDLIKYTSVGADAFLRITKALEIRAEASEIEVSRTKNEPTRNLPESVTVTLKGTLLITNRKADAVHMQITKQLTGEVLAADDNPVITKTAVGLNEGNSRAVLVWNLDVPARQVKKVSYTFKVILGR